MNIELIKAIKKINHLASMEDAEVVIFKKEELIILLDFIKKVLSYYNSSENFRDWIESEAEE